MLFDLADSSHPLAGTEDIIQNLPLEQLDYPVVVRVYGEDRVPYNLPDAFRLISTKGKGAFTRKTLRLDDIEPIRLTDSRLPPSHPTLVEYDARYERTCAALLYKYAFAGQIVGVTKMRALGADINSRSPLAEHNTPLHAAVYNNDKKMAIFLLRHCGARITGVSNDVGRTPFLTAVAYDCTDMVILLHETALARGKAVHDEMIHEADAHGCSALFLAIKRNHPRLMELLACTVRVPMDSFPLPYPSLRAHDHSVMTRSPFSAVIEYGRRPDYILQLIRLGADFSRVMEPERGRTLMSMAVAFNRIHHVRLLLELGCKPAKEDITNAVILNNTRMLLLLLSPVKRRQTMAMLLPLHDDETRSVGTALMAAATVAAATHTSALLGIHSARQDNYDFQGYRYDNNNDPNEAERFIIRRPQVQQPIDESQSDDEAGAGTDLRNDIPARDEDPLPLNTIEEEEEEEETPRILNVMKLYHVCVLRTAPASYEETGLPPALYADMGLCLVDAVNNDAYQAVKILCALRVPSVAALRQAVAIDKLWAIKLLLVAPTARDPWPPSSDTPLTAAIRLGRYHIISLITKAGLPPAVTLNVRVPFGKDDTATALDLAILHTVPRSYLNKMRAAGALTSNELSARKRKFDATSD